MTLITILFCVALQRFGNVGGWFQTSWFESYLQKLHPWLSKFNEWIGIGLIVIPVFIILGLVHLIFNWRFFGLFDLIFIVLVLLFCLDARDPKKKLADYYSSLEKRDLEAMTKATSTYLSYITPSADEEINHTLTKEILVRNFCELFSVLLWFIIFGTYGAVGYFLINLTHKIATKVDPNYTGLAKVAGYIIGILDWIPIRILGFTYALAGHFVKGFNYCVKHLWLPIKENQNFAINSGLAALDVTTAPSQPNEKETLLAIDLTNRSLIIWIVAILLFSLGYWM